MHAIWPIASELAKSVHLICPNPGMTDTCHCQPTSQIIVTMIW